MKRRPGFTLVELLVYLATAGIVLIAATTFVGRMVAVRAEAAAQTKLQENARVVIETMTVAIRNSYAVNASGSTVTILAHPASSPSDTNYTVFTLSGDQLQTGSGSDPDTIVPTTMVDEGVSVDNFTPQAIEGALQVHLALSSGEQSWRLDSTIAYRQQP